MATREEYLKAKSIVEEYEREYEDEYDEHLSWEEQYEIQEENRLEEESEYAANCTCGAWVFNSKGSPNHIADCICGAQ